MSWCMRSSLARASAAGVLLKKAVMAAKGDLKALLQDIKMQAGAMQENTTTVCCCFLGQSRGAAKCFRSSQGCVLF